MNDEQLLRYSRHVLLEEIGIEGQARIARGHALVIGAGWNSYARRNRATVSTRASA